MGFAYFDNPFDLLLNHFELFENFFVIQSLPHDPTLSYSSTSTGKSRLITATLTSVTVKIHPIGGRALFFLQLLNPLYCSHLKIHDGLRK